MGRYAIDETDEEKKIREQEETIKRLEHELYEAGCEQDRLTKVKENAERSEREAADKEETWRLKCKRYEKAFEADQDLKRIEREASYAKVGTVTAKIGKEEIQLPEIVDATDLLDDNLPPQKKDIWHGILPFGGKMLLGAASKSKKTFTLLGLTVAIAKGVKYWNHETTKSKVLYVNLELFKESFQRRLQKIKDEMKVEIEYGEIQPWHLRGYAMPIEALAPVIIEQAQRRTYGAIVIDPIYKCLGSRSENDAGDMASFCNHLEKISVQTGAAVICAHHFAKGLASAKDVMDRMAGSGVLQRDPDALIMMSPHEETDAYVCSAILRDHPNIADFGVRFQYPLMQLDESLNTKALKGATNAGASLDIEDVLEVCPPHDCKEHERKDKDDIVNRVKTSTDAGINRIKDTVKAAIAQGFLEEFLVKRSGTNPRKVYCLSEKGERKVGGGTGARIPPGDLFANPAFDKMEAEVL